MYLKINNKEALVKYNNLYKNNQLKGLFMYKVYSDTCYYCQLMDKEWEKFKNNEIIKKINLIEIEHEFKKNIDNELISRINRYPTILMVMNNNSVTEFNDERIENNFYHFVKESMNKQKGNGRTIKKKKIKKIKKTKNKKIKKGKSNKQ